MTADKIQQARAYVQEHEDVLVASFVRGDALSAALLEAYDTWYDNQHDTQAQAALVQAVAQHREGR